MIKYSKVEPAFVEILSGIIWIKGVHYALEPVLFTDFKRGLN